MRLIDANALKVSYCKQCLKETGNEQIEVKQTPYCAVACQDFDVIDKQPTVDAVPVRHAEWRPHPIKGCEEWDVCSACGIGTHRRLVSDLGEEEYSYNYCPWCGAIMDGEQ